jgi:hypothetical protein
MYLEVQNAAGRPATQPPPQEMRTILSKLVREKHLLIFDDLIYLFQDAAF